MTSPRTSHADLRFISAVCAMEARTRDLAAYVVYNPLDPKRWGKIRFSYNRDSAITRVVSWLPDGRGDYLWHYDRSNSGETGAMLGAFYFHRVSGRCYEFRSEGHSWREQLEAAGYIVVQAL